jgi:hypothetical protein
MFQPRISHAELIEDGSGAPAIVEACGMTWAFDCRGGLIEVRSLMPNVRKGKLERASRLVAQAAYVDWLQENATPSWTARNRAWYKEGPADLVS